MTQDEEHRTRDERQRHDDETQPLLQSGHADGGEGGDSRELLRFEEHDSENPRQWSYTRKMLNVATIASMAILSPLASSMFTPGIQQIAEGLDTDENMVIACTTGFVIMLGVGPLVLVCLRILSFHAASNNA